MSEDDRLAERLAERFEAERPRLRAIADRMLGSRSEADDAVQEAWLRLGRADVDAIDNLPGWLTTVVSRLCLDMLRTRRARHEAPSGLLAIDGPGVVGGGVVGGGVVGGGGDEAPAGPEDRAVTADSVGLALLVVLDRLSPAERVAFVLHDLFAVPFDEIAPVVDRSPVTAKKLASRARRRVRGTTEIPDPDLASHRRVVEAFLRATRDGDVEALLAVLAPEVVRRSDAAALAAGVPLVLRGAAPVADETRTSAERARHAEVALVDGRVGIVVAPAGRLSLVLHVTVVDGAITEIDVVADPARLAAAEVAVLPG